MKFHMVGRNCICNLCNKKLQTVTRRGGARILVCPGCGQTLRLTKRSNFGRELFTKKSRKRERGDNES